MVMILVEVKKHLTCSADLYVISFQVGEVIPAKTMLILHICGNRLQTHLNLPHFLTHLLTHFMIWLYVVNFWLSFKLLLKLYFFSRIQLLIWLSVYPWQRSYEHMKWASQCVDCSHPGWKINLIMYNGSRQKEDHYETPLDSPLSCQLFLAIK